MKWESKSLDNLCEEITVGFVGTMATHYSNDGILFLRSQNIEPYKLNLEPSQIKFITPEFHSKIKKSALKSGDIVIVRTGYPGTACVIPHDLGEANCADLVIARPKKEVDTNFVCYFINSPFAKALIGGSLVGSAQKHFNVGVAKRLEIPLPPFPTQQKIAAILSAYDDLIENNLRRIRLLEEAAQHLYREWFVRLRFPDWEEVNVVDGLPEGWERKGLGEFCFVNQNSISEKKAPETISYIDISSTSTGYFETPNSIPFKDAPSRARRIVRHGDTIFSNVRPNRRTFALVLNPVENLVVSTGFAVLTPKKTEDFPFVYLTVSNQDFVDRVSMVATGAAYPAVNQSDFEQMEIIVAPEKLRLSAFKILEPIFRQKENLISQNQKLKEARDILLPRLMNQTIEV